MKIKLLFLFILILSFSSCLDKSESSVTEYTTIKYDINITNDTITDYVEYLNNAVNEKVNYIFEDSIVYKITRNSIDSIIYKHTYYLNDNKYASWSIDSGFYTADGYIAHFEYEYENNYLKSIVISGFDNINNTNFENNLNYTQENGNIISITECINYCCTDNIAYKSSNNKIDIENFSNGVLGKISTNLPDSRVNIDCNNESSYFTYELNNEGYVTKRVQDYNKPAGTQYSYKLNVINTYIYNYNFKK